MSYNCENISDDVQNISLIAFRTGKTYDQVREIIERRAHRLWEDDGRQDGKCLDYWVLAESSILMDIRVEKPIE